MLHRKDRNDPNSPWISETNLTNFLATKVDARSLVIKEQMLAPGSLYRLTVDVVSSEGVHGWAAYTFHTLASPSGGTCYGSQLEREAVGTWFNLSCHGWKDGVMPLAYEFYRESESREFDLLSYGVWPYSIVHIPAIFGGSAVCFKVVIVNVLGTASEVHLLLQVWKGINRNSVVVVVVMEGCWWWISKVSVELVWHPSKWYN